mgnify:FL=1|jgi:biotin operon repressor
MKKSMKQKQSKIKQFILLLHASNITRTEAAKKLKTTHEYVRKMAVRLRKKGFNVKSIEGVYSAKTSVKAIEKAFPVI